ncbi:MBL fold metallo-hydrolase [Deinococcus sonorensis]|uniref:MBL fold metallo-hydrolase n=2 Tax=Deinococcus sonorensis TaxID=309891 RepID=A0AAU7UB42_9DEIO
MPDTLDLQFLGQPGVIATYVFDTGDGLALVDSGPASTLGALQSGLATLGATLADVRHLLLTHIHLDHAGAAGSLMAASPGARVYVHSRGAGHLARPERLLASAAQIYGDQMERLWGEMRPVPEERLTVLEGGETLRLGTLEARPLYTPGHAVHHLAYHVGDDLYVGDVGGIRLDARQSPRAPTPPPDIDLEAWDRSIEVLREVPALNLHLAHYGTYPQQAAHWDQLHTHLHADARVVREGLEESLEAQAVTERYTSRLMAALQAEGPDLPERYAAACPPWMSVQGLIRYWTRRAARS